MTPFRIFVTSLLGAMFFLLSVEISAQEWTRFRGPNGSGIGDISSLPPEITKMDYDWTVDLTGQGHSSPVVWENRLFLTVYDPDDKRRLVRCFHTRSGKLLWTWEPPSMEAHNLHKYNNFASATPTVDQDHLYVVWGSGDKTQAIALDHQGKLVWEREWPAFSSDHGNASSPIMADGKLVFHTDSVLEKTSLILALDPKTGETVWEKERITKGGEEVKHITAYNTPIVAKSGDVETIVALQTNDGWKGLNPASGTIEWAYPGNYTLRTVGSIAQSGNFLFATFGSGGGGKVATALRLNGSDQPEKLYELGIADGLSYVPSPLIYKDRLFLWGDGGVLTCREVETGEEIYKERIGGNFFSSPVIADGKIFCASRDGELVSVAAEGPFQILGRSRLPGGVIASPAIADNRLFIRSESKLISIRGK